MTTNNTQDTFTQTTNDASTQTNNTVSTQTELYTVTEECPSCGTIYPSTQG